VNIFIAGINLLVVVFLTFAFYQIAVETLRSEVDDPTPPKRKYMAFLDFSPSKHKDMSVLAVQICDFSGKVRQEMSLTFSEETDTRRTLEFGIQLLESLQEVVVIYSWNNQEQILEIMQDTFNVIPKLPPVMSLIKLVNWMTFCEEVEYADSTLRTCIRNRLFITEEDSQVNLARKMFLKLKEATPDYLKKSLLS